MLDRATVRRWVLDANDGVISTTGIIQGFAGAGANDETVLFAAMTVMVTGGLSLAGSAYAEAAQDRAADLETIEDERRRLALSPDEEQAELRQHYLDRGLDAQLADQVAAQLMRRDPLGAQLETEYGMLEVAPARPWPVALRSFGGFVTGALPLTLAVVFVPEPWRFVASIAVVIVSLALTGLVSAIAGTGHPIRTIVRSLTVGLFIALLSYLAGNIFELIDGFIPQIDVDGDVTGAGAWPT